jgi:hypothetical protein
VCSAGEGDKCNDFKFNFDKNDRVGMFVLGPSAAGKTYSTTSSMEQVLKVNNVKNPTQVGFRSLDGGIMRQVSGTWQTYKTLCSSKENGVVGCKDLFHKFQKVLNLMKRKVFGLWLTRGDNIVVVETASNGPSKVFENYYWPMRRHKYRVIMGAVYARLSKCQSNGRTRAFIEGKAYSCGMGLLPMVSWQLGMRGIVDLFNLARAAKNYETFFIVRNHYGLSHREGLLRYVQKDNVDTVEHLIKQWESGCDSNPMYHMGCGFSGANSMQLLPYTRDQSFGWLVNGGTSSLTVYNFVDKDEWDDAILNEKLLWPVPMNE